VNAKAIADVMKATTSQAYAIAAISLASAPNVLTCPFLGRDTCCWDIVTIMVTLKYLKGLNTNT